MSPGRTRTGTASWNGLRPWPPVHVRAKRESAGLVISFVRRTRIGGDGWSAVEVPLGETGEAYQLDILSGGIVKRTLTSTQPSILYPNASEIADFGAPVSALTVRVAQMSAIAGRGFPREITLYAS